MAWNEPISKDTRNPLDIKLPSPAEWEAAQREARRRGRLDRDRRGASVQSEEAEPPDDCPGGQSHRLDNNIQINTHNTQSSPAHPSELHRRKQRGRAWWLIQSANVFYRDRASWWLTLTSAPGQRDIYKSWNALRTRIDRTSRQDIINWLMNTKRPGHSAKEMRYGLSLYLGLNREEPLEHDYIAIKTSEGYGVYHIFVYGDFLPASWLRYWWKEYHNSTQLDIQRVKDTPDSRGKLSKYALAQYAAGQDQFVRISHSKNLIFKDARKEWLSLVEQKGYSVALPLWKQCMIQHVTPTEALKAQLLGTWMEIPEDTIGEESTAQYRAWKAIQAENDKQQVGGET